MNLIDTHAHLDSVKDIEGAMQRANDAGVSTIVAVGENRQANQKNIELSQQFQQPRIVVALGIHPGNIESDQIDIECDFIQEHIHEAQAIGEIGLDFWYKWVRKDTQKKDEQRQVYRRLLQIAHDHHLPALIHTRGTWREAFEITREMEIQHAVFHWYSGPLDVLEDILAQGYFVSAAPSIAYSPEARSAMEVAPVEQTLIETDSPVYYKNCDGGLAAEPKDVFCTLKHYALLKQRDAQDLAHILNKNAEKIFGL